MTQTDSKMPHFPKLRPGIYYPVLKRIVDICVSFTGLVLLVILLPIIAIAIKTDTKGPVIFSQWRIGKNMRLFKMYKFRTMLKNAEAMIDQLPQDDSPFLQRENDPRVTRAGAFLRRYSLDELPQFWNIIRGEMSFIGPRPFVEAEIEQLNPEHLRRLLIRPGLTGYAQINGRNDLSLNGRMEKDLYYVDHIEMWLDIRIFAKTIWVTFTRKGAY